MMVQRRLNAASYAVIRWLRGVPSLLHGGTFTADPASEGLLKLVRLLRVP